MKRLTIAVFILSSLFLACTKQPLKSDSAEVSTEVKLNPDDQTIISFGDLNLSNKDLTKELNTYILTDSSSFDSTLNDLIFRKRVYQEALKKGYGLNEAEKEEIAAFQGVLAKDYLIDSTTLNGLIDEAYKNLQNEVNVSHIFISFSPDSNPSDSVYIYNQLVSLKEEITTKESFDSLAYIYSQDKKTSVNGGELGWFSALQLLYPLEKAAYNLEVGEVSYPIRSSQGFHLLRLNNKRPNRGTVTVRHILKSLSDDATSEYVDSQKKVLDSLKTLILNGAEFAEISLANSDDLINRENGGLLAPFTVGSRAEVEFEKVAFSLKDDEVSDPVRSKVGWHLIQLVDKKPLGSKVELYDFIKSKVSTDSRGEFLENKSTLNAKINLVYQLNEESLNKIIAESKSSILDGSWKNSNVQLNQLPLYSFGSDIITAEEFLTFMEDRHKYDFCPAGYTSEMAVRRYFRIFENNLINEKSKLYAPKWNPLLETQVDQLKESLIISSFLNDNIIEKSVADTTGQRLYFEKNKELYINPARKYAISIISNNKSLIDEFEMSISQNKPYRLKRGIRPIYFSKNDYFIKDDDKRRLSGLIAMLNQNPEYIVEIGGHSDVAEEDYVSSSRIQSVVSYLIETGLSITRVREQDYLKTRPADRFDWSKNQRVSIQFFSNNSLDLLPSLDPDQEQLISLEKKWYTAIDDSEVFSLNENEHKSFEKDGKFRFIEVLKFQESDYKSLKESRASVIKSYQLELESKLKAELEQKYPLNMDLEEINKVKKALLNRN